MIYIESTSTNPYYNLALEEYVFEHLDQRENYFMLWQNENTIVVGKYQNTAEEVNQEFVAAQGIRVVRRLSGGGAVYHDAGNLNFTFIADQKGFADFNFEAFVSPVLRALDSLGVHAEFTGRNDLVLDGCKFSGNSQYAKGGRVLHHGCIMLDSNLDRVGDALRVREAKFTSKSVKSVRSRVTTINEHAPRKITMQEFKDALKQQVFGGGDVREYVLTEVDQEAVHALMREKYETWEWNYGFYRSYSIRREQKYAGGLFGSGDLHDLEQALQGVPLDEHLADRLQELGIGNYIHGVSAAEMALLMR